jgi:hypothetical protein
VKQNKDLLELDKEQWGDMRWSKYTLPSGKVVLLTQRPDRANVSSVNSFLTTWNPIVRFCFCDDYVNPPTDLQWFWLSWAPGRDIPIDNVFTFLSLMKQYEQSSEGPIWLHCDSSSMRAPTFFGLFLNAFYKDQVTEICEGMTTSENLDMKYANYSRADKYAEVSLNQDKGIKGLIESWQQGGEALAHSYYMNYKG